jgi:hypothetical protein
LTKTAIALSSGTNPRLLCEAYFAITSNTVQFGARAPLHFIADFHARLRLKRGWRTHLARIPGRGTSPQSRRGAVAPRAHS